MSWRLFFRAFAGCVVFASAGLLSACGGGGGGSAQPPAPPATIALHAGSTQMPGSRDGVGPDAQFNQPEGVAQDGAGNVYVADTANHTIRKIGPNGVVSTLAGTAGQAGTADGMGAAARFNFPRGIAVDAIGNVYVADTGNHAIRRVTPLGLVSTFAGVAGQEGFADGPAGVARFGFPTDLALDSAGSLYVASDSAIRKVAPDGSVITFAGVPGQSGLVAGDGAQARFGFVTGVAVDGLGNIYVSDGGPVFAGVQTLRRFDAAGHALPLGTATGGILTVPFVAGIAADNAGNAYVAAGGTIPQSAPTPALFPSFNSILKVTPQGEITVVAGKDQEGGHTDGPGTIARFRHPSGIAVGAGGKLIIADTDNVAIRQIDAQNVVSTISGGAGLGYVDGPGPQARFSSPRGLAAAVDGTLFVADAGNQAIRKITPSGIVSTLQLTTEDGAQAATIGGISQIAADQNGGIYVALAGRSFSTVFPVNSDGRLGKPVNTCNCVVSGMATDRSGQLYMTEQSQVSLIARDGTKQTIASGFKNAAAVAVNESGTFYIADSANHTVHAFDAGGNALFTVGRAGKAGYQDGIGVNVLFNFPGVLALDAAGNLYIADASNTIRKLSADGAVTTIAGVPGLRGLQTGLAPGILGPVAGMAWNSGTLYALVANAVVKISPVN